MKHHLAIGLCLLLLLLTGCTYKQNHSFLSEDYQFSIFSINKTSCYGRFAAEGYSDAISDEIFKYIDSSKGFAKDARITTSDENGTYGYKLLFSSNPAIKKACLKISKYSISDNPPIFCDICTGDANKEPLSCVLIISEQIEQCKTECEVEYANSDVQMQRCLETSCTTNEVKRAFSFNIRKEAKFEIEPDCTEFRVKIKNTKSPESIRLRYGEAVVITNSGEQYNSLDVCDTVSDDEIYPGTERVNRYCFNQIKEEGSLYLKVGEDNNVKQVKLPYKINAGLSKTDR